MGMEIRAGMLVVLLPFSAFMYSNWRHVLDTSGTNIGGDRYLMTVALTDSSETPYMVRVRLPDDGQPGSWPQDYVVAVDDLAPIGDHKALTEWLDA